MPLKKKFGGLGPTMLTLMHSRGKIMPRTVFFVNFSKFLYVLLWEGRRGGEGGVGLGNFEHLKRTNHCMWIFLRVAPFH